VYFTTLCTSSYPTIRSTRGRSRERGVELKGKETPKEQKEASKKLEPREEGEVD